MKKRTKTVINAMLVLAVLVFLFSSCEGEVSTPTSIAVTFNEDVTVYEDTSLDELRSALTVEAVYGNGTRKEITDYTLSGSLSLGECSLTVKYRGCQNNIVLDVKHPHVHMIVRYDAKAATCTQKGWEAYARCFDCGYSSYSETNALGHDFEGRVCSRCQCYKESEGLEFNTGTIASETCYVTGIGACTDSILVIPEKDPHGRVVVGIWGSAFKDCDNITSVVIPETVKYISRFAFCWCDNLTSVVIPRSLLDIGEDAFDLCHNLTDIKYRGTEEEWLYLTKGIYWYPNADYTLVFDYSDEQ